MEVTQLWRYPVKSMIGERVEVIDLDDVGVVGDRTWAYYDAYPLLVMTELALVALQKALPGWSATTLIRTPGTIGTSDRLEFL